ncbi:MAG: rhodanese-like domain-containing protein [Pseudomonadota bacterium]
MLTRRTLVLGLAAALPIAAATATPATLSVTDARQAALDGDILLIDIRTPAEWQASGVADVAHPLSMIDRHFGRDFVALLEANPGKRPAFICATGVRSSRLIRLMAERGLHATVDVPAGMMGEPDGWIASGLPTVRWSP